MDMIDDETTATDVVEAGVAERAARGLIAYRAGFPTLMGEVVREVTPLLWHAVRAQGVSRDDAEDVVQGVWVTFVVNVDSIRDPQAVLRWLLVAARRAARARVRDRHAELVRQASAQEKDAAERDQPVADAGVASVLLEERDRMLWTRFRELPPRCQELLKLVSIVQRPDYREISAALDMPVASIGPTRGRCLTKFRTLLDDDVRDVR